jgi:hypothetical protein
VIAGIRDDDAHLVEGARVFDETASGKAGAEWSPDWEVALEITSLAGPAGRFFTDGISLFSSNKEGLSRWCVEDGSLTGQVQGFEPAHHHRAQASWSS